MAPANTGKLNSNSIAVINTDHTNKGNLSKLRPGLLIFIIVTFIFIAPNNDDTPAICNDNIDRSTAGPLEYPESDNGG
jgi:hypothetical protein